MATTDNLTDFLTGVADAIRAKKSTTALINPQNFASEIASISGGGGGEEPQPEGTHKVTFMDVDGTILKTEYVEEGGSATAPANPTREKCEFVKWLNAYTNITKDTDVFALYKSADGNTWYRVKAAANDRMSLSIRCDSTSPVTIDWGDGATDTATNTSSYTVFRHDYASAFDGWVKVSSEGGYRPSTPDEGNPCVKEVIVGDNVGTVGSVAREMTNLTAIVIPETVAAYEGRPFRHCVSLVSLALPDGVTTISTDTASAMIGLRYVRLPATFTSLPQSLLSYCSSLQSVEIPSGVTSIGSSAFQNCYIAVLSVNPDNFAPSSATFQYCRRLTGPLNLQRTDAIPYDAFSYTGITSLYAKTLKLTRTANGGAFCYCTELTRVELPDITDMGTHAFNNCTALTLAIIGEDITNIGSRTFYNCSALERLVVKAPTPPTLTSDALQGCSALQGIYVPDDSVETYKAATNWVAYADKILPLSEFTE